MCRSERPSSSNGNADELWNIYDRLMTCHFQIVSYSGGNIVTLTVSNVHVFDQENICNFNTLTSSVGNIHCDTSCFGTES